MLITIEETKSMNIEWVLMTNYNSEKFLRSPRPAYYWKIPSSCQHFYTRSNLQVNSTSKNWEIRRISKKKSTRLLTSTRSNMSLMTSCSNSSLFSSGPTRNHEILVFRTGLMHIIFLTVWCKNVNKIIL